MACDLVSLARFGVDTNAAPDPLFMSGGFLRAARRRAARAWSLYPGMQLEGDDAMPKQAMALEGKSLLEPFMGKSRQAKFISHPS